MRNMRGFDPKCIVITTVLSLSLMLIPGWECNYPLGQGDHWSRENPWVEVLYVTPSTVILPETGTAHVALDFTSNRHESTPGFWYETGDPNWPAGLTMSPLDAQPDVSGRFRTRFVVETQGTKQGMYRVAVKLRWSEKTVVETAMLTVVVFPSGIVGTPPAIQIAAGANHTLAILQDGSVWSWGANTYGQLGDGSTWDRLAPVPVQGLPGSAQAIAAGAGHSLALLHDGTVWGWGDNRRSQLSPEILRNTDPILPMATTPTPVFCTAERCRVLQGNAWLEGPLRNIIAIAAGQSHSLALTSDGIVITFGSNLYGQLGRPGVQSPRLADEVPLNFYITAIAAGDEFSLALDNAGYIWGWGRNGSGQLGDHSRPQFDSPREIPFMMNIQAIAAGGHHTLALKTDGTVRTVGSNQYGQLGDPAYSGPTATPVYGLPPISAIAAGYAHSLALGTDGRIYAFGDSGAGQIGIPESHWAPSGIAPIQGLLDVQAITAGNQHSLCLVSDCPDALSWGDNRIGQLGDGTVQSSTEPVQIDGLGQAGDPPPCDVSLSVIVVGEGRVRSEPWGIECGANCSELFAANTQLTLTAEPTKGWIFEEWTGDVQGSESTAVIVMDRSKNCRARFTREPIPPTASFTVTPPSPLTTDTVTFDASGSSDDGEIIRYEWDFTGDGIYDLRRNRTETNVSFVASFVDNNWRAGTHTVLLRVTDDDGLSDTTTRDVRVAAAEPPEHDLGDAPDSSSTVPRTVMLAYGDTGVEARFPTVYGKGSPPYGPVHRFPGQVHLGSQVTLENEADVGVDQDPNNNLSPVLDRADQDGGDDGVVLPLTLPYCGQATLDYLLNIVNPPWEYLYVNVWFDWNRDGDWDDTLICPNGTEAPEWAVQDDGLSMFLSAGIHAMTTSAFQCWHPSQEARHDPLWMRITVSEYPRWTNLGDPNIAAHGGAGPEKGYRLGETEDYLIYPQ